MTTRRQAALQPTAGRGRKSLDAGIKAYMSPRTPELAGRLDLKKRSGINATDGEEKAERESGIKQVIAQMTGDCVSVNGKRPPTVGRGRKTPEQSPPGRGGGSPQVIGLRI